MARRLELLAGARESGAWIVEDDYASEFRYSGRPLASLQGLDEAERVIYIGTFNKALFPTRTRAWDQRIVARTAFQVVLKFRPGFLSEASATVRLRFA
jgi:hypothetical protein